MAADASARRDSGSQDDHLAESFGALEPVEGRVAGAQVQVDLGEVGMGRRAPGGLHDARRPLELAPPGQDAGGDASAAGTRSGASLTASSAAASAPSSSVLGAAEGVGGEQHRALAPDGGAVHHPERGAAVEVLQRAAPVALGRLRLENRLVRPAGRRGEARRLGGVKAGRLPVVAPPGLDEQAAQAEHARLVPLGHAAERGLGGFAVAGGLGGLGLEKERQRLPVAPEQPLGLAGVAPGRRRVAGAHRDHAARQGREAPLALGALRATADRVGEVEEIPDRGPDEGEHDGERQGPDQKGGRRRSWFPGRPKRS